MIFKIKKYVQYCLKNFTNSYKISILRSKSNFLLLILFFFINLNFPIQYSKALTLEKSIEDGIANNQELAIEMQKIENLKLQNWRVLQENLPAISLNFAKGNRQSKNLLLSQNYQQNQFTSKELQIEQNLFSGFSTFFNYEKYRLEYLKNLAIYNDKKQILANQIASLYSKIFYQEKIINNLDKILEFYEKIIKNERLRLKFGIITNLEIQNLETAILKVSQQILVAKSENFTNHQDFDLMAGFQAKNLEILNQDVKEKIIKYEPQLIDKNYSLQAKNFELKILQEMLKLNYANFAPKISLQIGFSRQNNNNLYFPNQEIQAKSVGLNVVIPIFQRGSEYLDFKQMQNNQNIAFDEFNFLRQRLLNELKKDCFELENAFLNQQKCWEMQKIIDDKINDAKYKLTAKFENINNLYFLQISNLEAQIQCHRNQVNIDKLHFKILANIGGMNV